MVSKKLPKHLMYLFFSKHQIVLHKVRIHSLFLAFIQTLLTWIVEVKSGDASESQITRVKENRFKLDLQECVPVYSLFFIFPISKYFRSISEVDLMYDPCLTLNAWCH